MTVPVGEVALATFDQLVAPVPVENGFAVRTRELPNTPGAWVGKDSRARPVLLVAVGGPGDDWSPRVELTNFSYRPSARCSVTDDTGTEERHLAVLHCLAEDRDLHIWFLRTVTALLRELECPPNQAVLDRAVDRLVRLFVALGQPGSGSVQGLWGELLLIARGENPNFLLRAWHGDPLEAHDFVAGLSRAEVKTALGGRREHHFSIDQLTPPEGGRLLVLSLLLERSSSGQSIADLVAEIQERVGPSLAAKLHEVVTQTLGSDWRRAADQRFSAEAALESLAAYDSASVPRVSADIPPEVRDVRFAVEMWGLPTVAPADLRAVELWSAFGLG